ncbi:sensor domain-containing protein [Nonomuraea indica]|uniref:sensor domain-containing protein n=1 Tax=Nonomuraea indica TaxID=1581193 RepID=UPI000C7DEB1B|nr:sensor domain-containing protein [Nonomuraea indica]
MTTLRQRIATDTRYALGGFPAATISFALVVSGMAAGIGSLVAVVGVPILGATAATARRFADTEREMVAEVLEHPVGRPVYPDAPPSAGLLRRLANPVAGAQGWLDMLHAVIAFPFAVLSFAVTLTWWVGAIAGLSFPLYGWILAAIPGMEGLPELLGLGDGTATFVIFNTAVGALFAVTLPPVVRGMALVRATLAQAMLTRPVRPAVQEPFSPYADLLAARRA